MSVEMRSRPSYGRLLMIAIGIAGPAACHRGSVNGDRLPANEPCTRSWTAVVDNTTNRVYDLYVGTRLIGSADPHIISRTVIDPRLGQVTPTLVESATTR